MLGEKQVMNVQQKSLWASERGECWEHVDQCTHDDRESEGDKSPIAGFAIPSLNTNTVSCTKHGRKTWCHHSPVDH